MTTPWRGRQRAATRRRGLLGTALALAIMVLVLVPAGGLPEAADALPFVPPGLAHPFGTDDLGRDLLREVARGVRTSLLLGGVVTATALMLGIAVGLAAGMGSPLTDELLRRGARYNGTTSFDRTNYFERVPANYLELALWMESDRMGFLLPALTEEKFSNQRDVVLNERRQNYENRPYGIAGLAMLDALFPDGHPYRWATIGSPDDLRAATADDVRAFFRTVR